MLCTQFVLFWVLLLENTVSPWRQVKMNIARIRQRSVSYLRNSQNFMALKCSTHSELNQILMSATKLLFFFDDFYRSSTSLEIVITIRRFSGKFYF